MGSAEDTTSYTPLPRDRISEDTTRAYSPEEPLLAPSIAPSSPIISPSSIYNAHSPINTSSSYTLPISPLLILRTISTILAFTSFLMFFIPGSSERTFLGAAILLMHIITFNLFVILRSLFSSRNYKLSVEFHAGLTSPSSQNINRDGKTVSRLSCVITPFLDLLLALSLCGALLVSQGNARRWGWPANFRDGMIIAWVVMGFQIFLALAGLLKRCTKRDLILTAQINVNKAPSMPLTVVQHTGMGAMVGLSQEGRQGVVQESLV